MNKLQKPSDAWRTFVYATTATSLLVVAGIIFFTEIDKLIKVSLAVATAWSLSNAVTLTKLLRDKQDYTDWEQAQKTQTETGPRQRPVEA